MLGLMIPFLGALTAAVGGLGHLNTGSFRLVLLSLMAIVEGLGAAT